MSSAAHTLHVLGMDLDSCSRAGALDRLRETSPAAFTIMLQWQALRDAVAKAKTPKQKEWEIARQLQQSYDIPTRFTLEHIYRRLGKQIRTARQDLNALFTEYLPPEICRKVTPQLRDLDPVHLIELGLPSQDGQLQLAFERMQFEARQALLLGLLFFDITVERWCGKDPAEDPNQLTRFLVEQGIFEGHPKPCSVLSYHDPDDEFNCVGIKEWQEPPSVKGMVTRHTKVMCAALRIETRTVPIIYSIRPKKPLSLIRRMLVDNEWDPRRVRDLRAFRFCYFSPDDLLASYGTVAQRLLPGTTGEVRDRFTQSGRNLNPHSAPTFRGIKHQARIGGRIYEVDHLLAETWFSIEYAQGLINHGWYHARQMWEQEPPGLFLCVAPEQVYGVDWTDEKVQSQIRLRASASHH